MPGAVVGCCLLWFYYINVMCFLVLGWRYRRIFPRTVGWPRWRGEFGMAPPQKGIIVSIGGWSYTLRKLDCLSRYLQICWGSRLAHKGCSWRGKNPLPLLRSGAKPIGREVERPMAKSKESRRQQAVGGKERGDAVAMVAIGACLLGLSSVVFRAVRLVGVGAAIVAVGLRRKRRRLHEKRQFPVAPSGERGDGR